MGSSESSEEPPLALPQQRIVSVVDGHVEAAGGAGATGSAGRVGSSQEAKAVRAPFTLTRGGLRLDAGALVVGLSACADGTLEVLAPALECPGAGTWPAMVSADGAPPLRQAFARGCREVRLEGLGPRLGAQDAMAEALGDGGRRWPCVLVLWPGAAPGAPGDPPDGALMACCCLRRGRLEVARQLVAWGGGGAAYVMKELYGVQEALAGSGQGEGGAAAEGEGQRNCVVCLTTAKDTALMPCGHFCVCYECGASLRLAPARNRCPLCRQEVHDIMRIEFAAMPAGESSPVVDGSAVREQEATEAQGITLAHDPEAAGTEAPGPTAAVETEAAPATEGAAAAAGSQALGGGSSSSTSSGAGGRALSPDELRAARLAALGRSQPQPQPQQLPEAPAAQPQSQPQPPQPQQPPEAPAVQEAAAPAPQAAEPAGAGGRGLPPRCLQRLTREMRQIEEQRAKNLEEHGVELGLRDPEGGDLRAWTLRVLTRAVDGASRLGRELRAHGVEAVELEVWIPDTFPVQPPRLRVLRPCFGQGSFFVFQHGALCLEILTAQGWTPAMSLPQLGVQVKTMMSQGSGTVAGSGYMGDPGPSGRESAWSIFHKIETSHSDWKVFSTG